MELRLWRGISKGDARTAKWRYTAYESKILTGYV